MTTGQLNAIWGNPIFSKIEKAVHNQLEWRLANTWMELTYSSTPDLEESWKFKKFKISTNFRKLEMPKGDEYAIELLDMEFVKAPRNQNIIRIVYAVPFLGVKVTYDTSVTKSGGIKSQTKLDSL